ncbi:MAG: hypothetical protein ABI231_06215 [Candidatus Tumulicola sp.]
MAISMWPVQGDEKPITGTVHSGAYYFDETNCGYCVLRLTLRDGTTGTLGVNMMSASNFTLTRHNVSRAALSQAKLVRGSPFNAPEKLVQGPKGTIWSLDRLGNRVAVIGPGLRPHEYDLPTPFSDAGDIVGTPRFVWVSERRVGKIVRFAVGGKRSEFTLVHRAFMTSSLRTILGADGRIWFTDGWNVGCINEQGVVTNFRLHTLGTVNDLAVGSDDRIWIVGQDGSGDKGGPFMATLDDQGGWKRFPLAFEPSTMRAARGGFWIAGSSLSFVDNQGHERPAKLPVDDLGPKLYVVDPSNRLWFSDKYGNMILHADIDGSVTASYTTFGPAGISDMVIDHAATVWIAEPHAHVVEQYGRGLSLPPRGVNPRFLLPDSSDNLWYSDPNADVIGVIVSKTKRGRCYAFRLATIKNCSFGRADLVGSALKNKIALANLKTQGGRS